MSELVINTNSEDMAAAQGICTSLAASSAHPHIFEIQDQYRMTLVDTT